MSARFTPRAAWALAAGLMLACGGVDSDAEPSVSAGPARELTSLRPEPVTTAPVRRGAIQTVITATGSIIARRSTALGPAVPGRILHVFVDLGDRVSFAAPVFQIDPGPYAAALREARAGLALANAELSEARDEAERARQLVQKKMTSDQKHRRARTRAEVASARVEQARARVSRVEHDLSRTLVLAPYAGSIVERMVHEGMMATVRPNTHVVVLQESDALEAELDIPEASQAIVRRGDRVRLYVDGIPEPIESQVRAASDRIDPKSRTYSIRAPIASAADSIKAGAFVRAEVEPQAREGALLVDRSAITRREGRSYVFRVAEGLVEQVSVRVGTVGPRDVELLSGVALGDSLVVGAAVSRLGDGVKVEVHSERNGGEQASDGPVGPVAAGATLP